MKTQHTPGPWEVRGGNVIENPSGVNIAKAWMTDGEEECANARLIAAAPDLLKALIDVMSDPYFSKAPTRYEHARAAIAKAEGRTE